MRRRARVPGAALALPAWFWFVFFFLVPVLWIAYYSLGRKPDLFHPIAMDRLSLDQYALGASDTFLATFAATLRIALLGTALCLLVAFPFAYWLAVRLRAARRPLALALVLVPFWTNFLVRTIGWRIVLAPSGPAAGLLHAVGLHPGPLQVLDTRAAVQLGVVYNYLPLMILPLYVALDRLDPAMREASADLGAGRLRTLLQVTLPLAAPGVVAGVLLVFIPLSGDFITATVLGGAKGNMVGQMVYDQFLVAQNWALGSAMAVELILLIMAAVAVMAAGAGLGRAVVRTWRRVDVVPAS